MRNFGWPCRLFDLCLLATLAGWVLQWLPHGADARRLALLLGAAGACWAPLREGSLVLRWVRKALLNLESSRARWTTWAGITLFSCLLGAAQALAIRYPIFDVGIFHQVIWSVRHGEGFASSLSEAGNFLRDHFSPSLALLTPFFWVSQDSALTLPIVHAFLVWGGVAAWMWMAERLPDSDERTRKTAAAMTLVFAVGMNSLWANLRWGFHESALSFTCVSWALALLLAQRRDEVLPAWRDPRGYRPWLAMGLLLIAALSKEIELLNLAGLWLVWAMTLRREHRAWSIALLLCVGLAVGSFVQFESLPKPADKNYFDRYYAYLGNGLGPFLATLIRHPGKVLEALGPVSLLRYLKDLLWPWLGLPLLWGWNKFRRREAPVGLPLTAIGAVFLPSMASQALSTYPPLRDPGFHYVLELWPVLAVLTLLALGWIARTQGRGRFQRWGWSWAFFALLSWDQDPLRQARDFVAEATLRTDVRARMAEIPQNATVAADDLAGPWIANRSQATRIPSLSAFAGDCPEWILRFGEKTVPPEDSLAACLSESQLQWTEGGWTAYRNGRLVEE